ncbi:MAG: chromate efflux transporter [Anaerolineae bacterium]|nr:chromate efflux transporter [Anaerolineae bacterium]
MTETTHAPPRVAYSELIRLFLRLSITAFGGPLAHIAVAEDEIVTRRKWLTREHYLDLVSATNLIPGPNSTEVMIHVGYVMRGIPGAIVTGVCFIAPAMLLTLALAMLYVSSGTIPQVQSMLWGIAPVIIAIIAQVGWRLAQTALKNRVLWVLFIVAALVLFATPTPEVLVMLGAGLIYALYRVGIPAQAGTLALVALPTLVQAAQNAPATLWDLFWYFLKIGSVLFGSGYVLITYIQQDIVNGFGWLSAQQLLDAVAIGQTTPGPVLTTVTVVGYIVAGLPGALLATLGVFLPSFVLVILTAPLIPRMRRSRFLGAFLTGVNAGVIAAIGVTLLDLINAGLRNLDGSAWSPLAILLALGALVLLLRFRLNATWLIAAGGLIGVLAGAFGVA